MKKGTTRSHACVGLVVLIVVLVALGLPSIRTVEANTGCPEDTSNFGNQTFSGTCTITNDTTWENGTLTIAGDIVVNAPLTLRDMVIIFNPSFEGEFELIVYDALDIQGGGIQSTNSNQWRVEVISSSSISIVGGTFSRGTWNLHGGPAFIEGNLFENSNARMAVGGQHMRVGPNSTVRFNVLNNIELDVGAAIVLNWHWGNSIVWGNELHLKCYGSNCMGIETNNMHEDLTSLYPGFPVVEVAWNNITWEEIASGTNSASLDHEYSMRLYVHNNTQYVNPAGLASGESVTSPLQMGGPLDSVFENNVIYGPSSYGIYNYIYSDASNLVQYNKFFDVRHGGIFQTGGNTYRHNEFVNVSATGIWICPNAPCAGASNTVHNNVWYGNSFSYLPGATIARASPSNMFDNTLIHHGNGQVNQWWDGANYRTVLGDGSWLYWANADIDSLRFMNETDGSRRVVMTVGGQAYDSTFVGFGATDNAELTIAGTIDREGSANVGGVGDGTF
ncbi:MAG: hypothetical protein ACE5IJ_07095, partial [Thermoplasmata archaeon]